MIKPGKGAYHAKSQEPGDPHPCLVGTFHPQLGLSVDGTFSPVNPFLPTSTLCFPLIECFFTSMACVCCSPIGFLACIYIYINKQSPRQIRSSRVFFFFCFVCFSGMDQSPLRLGARCRPPPRSRRRRRTGASCGGT